MFFFNGVKSQYVKLTLTNFSYFSTPLHYCPVIYRHFPPCNQFLMNKEQVSTFISHWENFPGFLLFPLFLISGKCLISSVKWTANASLSLLQNIWCTCPVFQDENTGKMFCVGRAFQWHPDEMIARLLNSEHRLYHIIP